MSHLSVKDMYYGTVSYDSLCVISFDFSLASNESVEERIEERHLLNGENFDKTLCKKLKDKMHRQSMGGNRNDIASLQTQIKIFTLSKEDSRAANITDEDLDLSDPKELFDHVQRQAPDDGHINELTRILAYLVTLPSSAGGVWHNVSHIVGEVCQPIQTKMLKDSQYCRATATSSGHGGTTHPDAQPNAINNLLTVNANIKLGTAIETRIAMVSVFFNRNEDYFVYQQGKGSGGDQAFKHLLKIKEEQDEEAGGPRSKTAKQLKEELAAARNGPLKSFKELEKLTREFDELKNGCGNDVAKIAEEVKAAPAKDDGYNKYHKMLKIHQQNGVLPGRNAMTSSSSGGILLMQVNQELLQH